MSAVAKPDNSLENTVFGHEPGLFLLFFTEMWERFSYYGMRALLVLFLIGEIAGGGWGWSRKEALELYALYTGLVYLTPILGGIVADKLLGYRNAVILGALLMTLGHGALAFETPTMFYTGLGLLIFGNGFFKPNISTIVGQLYINNVEKKDAAYTIFYMGINAGAFLGILLCGFVGEQISWSLGFGLAGVFMLLGMIMFFLGQSIFGEVGKKGSTELLAKNSNEPEAEPAVVKDRLIVVGVLAFFTIFFWLAFEQAGGSLTIFAKDYTGRVLTGNAHMAFVITNTFLTIAPLAIVTWVLFKLCQNTYSRIPLSNIAIGISFVLIWITAIFMLSRQFNSRSYEITYSVASEEGEATDYVRTVNTINDYEDGATVYILDKDKKGGAGKLQVLNADVADKYETKISAVVKREKQAETEVPASWFQILNSFFIIAFAPLFSKIWESRFNPSASFKFALGMILLGLGFGAVAWGSSTIPKGADSASVSLWWLVLAYLFHTLGELCLSPVGLSYVSKLAPARLVGLMFGVWFGATAVANYLAGWTGSYIDSISEQIGLVGFFLMFTAIPIVAGLVLIALGGWIKKMMHGIE